MNDKRVVILGGTRGIGFAVATLTSPMRSATSPEVLSCEQVRLGLRQPAEQLPNVSGEHEGRLTCEF